MLSVPFNTLESTEVAFLAHNLEGEPASLPVPNPTRSFWIDTPGANRLAKEGSDGPLTADADICIIGSGITGVSAAYHLSKIFATAPESTDGPNTPIKVVILEARDFCSGATGRNGGHLTPFVFLDFQNRETKYGAEQAAKSYELENHTAKEIAEIIDRENLKETVDFVAGGHNTLLLTELELQRTQIDYERAKLAGVDLSNVQLLNSDAMQKQYGIRFPAYRASGHNIWPLKFVTELYELAKKQTTNISLSLHTSTPVTDATPIRGDSERRWLLSTPRGDVKVSYVIHATNAYASHLLPQFSGPNGIVPTRGQVLALRAKVPISELSTSSWDGNEGFEYWHPKAQGTGNPLIILGGGRETAAPDFEYNVTDDSAINPTVSKALQDYLPELFPAKYESGRAPEMEWSGIMGYTKLGDPFVGPVVESNGNPSRYKGQYIAAGYHGHGMPRAYACAEVVAGMVAANIRTETYEIPDWLPERYLTWTRKLES